MYAPIALFTYNRPDKTQRVLESLMQNAEAKDSDLFIFSDGPKNENAVEGVKANREYLHSFKDSLHLREGWGGSVTIIEREKNWGLANSLIAGITEVINKYGRIIVVEDDLILSPYFLKFMNDGLDKYEHKDRVGAISAYVPDVDVELPNTFFLKLFHCWGWAIWKRSWDLLNTDTKYLLRKLRFKANEFDYNIGAYGNLYCQKIGLVDSWWVRLYASLFLANKLTLYPGKPLAINNGLDGSGTHCTSAEKHRRKLSLYDNPISIEKIDVMESIYVKEIIKRSFSIDSGKKSLTSKIKSFVRRFLYIDCL